MWCSIVWADPHYELRILEEHLFMPEGHLFVLCGCIMFDLYYAHMYKFSSAHTFIFTKYFSLMSLWGTTECNEWLHEQGSAYEDMMTTIN